MNVFDFDGTLLTGDTEVYFFRYLFKTRKDLFLYRINYHFWRLVLKKGLTHNRTLVRQNQYRVLKRIDDIDSLLDDFWKAHKCYMKNWYRLVHSPSDVIASATPAFLLEPMVRTMDVAGLVATDMDKKTGKITGNFTSHQYKVDAFKARYDVSQIDTFYSDAYSDHFMADLAKQAYAVHDDDIISEWHGYWHEKGKE